MTTYAVAHLQQVTWGPDIEEYLRHIDDTLAPFEGRFIVHGVDPTVLEGESPGHLVVIAFPSREQAQDWYDSPAYREILPLRLNNSVGTVFLVDGVSQGHKATDLLT